MEWLYLKPWSTKAKMKIVKKNVIEPCEIAFDRILNQNRQLYPLIITTMIIDFRLRWSGHDKSNLMRVAELVPDQWSSQF